MRPNLPCTFVAVAGALAALGAPALARAAAEEKPRTPIVLAAPAGFAAAVRAVEGATGAKAQKLGEVPEGEARAFEVDPAVAERLLEGSHGAFRRAGIYLFRVERSYGMPGEKDRLALMNTADWRAVVRKVGTAGPSRRPSSDEVAAWLEALAKDEPFELFEVGTDYLFGRFERSPKDAALLAKRCAEFAPDLVAGRATTLALLAREIEERRTLYLIW
jgi:hypothetical protein